MVIPYPLPSQYHQAQQNAQSHQYRSLGHHMDRPSSEYTQSPLQNSNAYPSYSTTPLDQQSAENQSTPQHASTNSHDARSNYSSSATPTSEASAIYSRTPTFAPDQILATASRYVEGTRYQPASSSTGGMAQNVSASSSPGVKADPENSEESSVAAPSPAAYPPSHYGSPYQSSPHAMSEGYSHPGAQGTGWARDAWSAAGYAPHQMSASPYHTPSPTTMAAAPPGMPTTARPVAAPNKAHRKRAGEGPPGHPLSQVYSFVPIPGAQQNKRPRRRYEEIERMYKCGWNGCEKAYGTLNHLNAHVTMQGHGSKRTPEEFKEIRKEWKARKKEEEAQRKAAEEEQRRRQAEEGTGSGSETQPAVTSSPYVGGMPPQRQLPPPSLAAYQSPNVSLPNGGVHYSTATAPTAPMENMQQFAGQPQMYGAYQPQYGGQSQAIYAGQQRPATSQSNGNTNTNTGGEEPDADAEPDPDVTAPASTYSS